MKEIFFFTKYMYVSVQIIGQVDVDKKAELERKKLKCSELMLILTKY